jgi:hypothetical protein
MLNAAPVITEATFVDMKITPVVETMTVPFLFLKPSVYSLSYLVSYFLRTRYLSTESPTFLIPCVEFVGQ